MYIVYGSSTRLQSQNNKWFYIDSEIDSLPREEALSYLWDAKEKDVIYILANAKSEIAVQFALRIIKDNAHFLENVDDTLLVQLVSHYHPKVLESVLDIVEQRFQLVKPESALLLALIKSNNERAQVLGFKWLTQYESQYFIELNFSEQLLLLGNDNVIIYFFR